MMRCGLAVLIAVSGLFQTAAAHAASADVVYGRVSASIVKVTVAHGTTATIGSGVIVGPGRVVTNCHVTQHATSISLSADRKAWPATLSTADPANDICMLDVPGLKGPAVATINTASLRVGQAVYAVGNPEGMSQSISEGIVSALRARGRTRLIQTTAAISHGSSGGGLFDAEGRLVGITSFKIAGAEGLNFAVSAEMIPAINLSSRSQLPLPSPGRRDWAAQVAEERDPAARAELCRQWTKAVPRELRALRCIVQAPGVRETERLQAASAAYALAPLDRDLMLQYADLLRYEISVPTQIARLSAFLSSPAGWTNEQRSQLQLFLAGSYAAANEPDKARRALKESTLLDPRSAKAWEALARDLFDDPAEAAATRAALQKALALKPKHSPLWQLLATSYARQNDLTNAILAQQQAIDTALKTPQEDVLAEIFPESQPLTLAWMWLRLAQLNMANTTYHEVLAATREALKMPENAADVLIVIQANLLASESHSKLGNDGATSSKLRAAVAACEKWDPNAPLIRDPDRESMLTGSCSVAWQRFGTAAGVAGDLTTKRKAHLRLTILDPEMAKTLE